MTPLPMTDEDRAIFNTLFEGDMPYADFSTTAWSHLFVFDREKWRETSVIIDVAGGIFPPHSFMYSVDGKYILLWINAHTDFHRRRGAPSGLNLDFLVCGSAVGAQYIVNFGVLYIVNLGEFKNGKYTTVKYIKDRAGLAERMTPKQQMQRFCQELNTYTEIR